MLSVFKTAAGTTKRRRPRLAFLFIGSTWLDRRLGEHGLVIVVEYPVVFLTSYVQGYYVPWIKTSKLLHLLPPHPSPPRSCSRFRYHCVLRFKIGVEVDGAD